MVVALTSSINLVFGSQVLDPDTGVLLNDEGNDFLFDLSIFYQLMSLCRWMISPPQGFQMLSTFCLPLVRWYARI
jgi:hypothetical protein